MIFWFPKEFALFSIDKMRRNGLTVDEDNSDLTWPYRWHYLLFLILTMMMMSELFVGFVANLSIQCLQGEGIHLVTANWNVLNAKNCIKMKMILVNISYANKQNVYRNLKTRNRPWPWILMEIINLFNNDMTLKFLITITKPEEWEDFLKISDWFAFVIWQNVNLHSIIWPLKSLDFGV